MFCPYCDSLIRELPDSGTCPRCGGALSDAQKTKITTDVDSLEPPVGVYKQTFGYMEIDNTSVRFYEKFWVSEVVDRRILFSDITKVLYHPGRGFKSGFLSVRSKENQNEPWPKTEYAAMGDKTTVTFIEAQNETFKKVYDYLKLWANHSIADGTQA